jgi:pyruvate ferredoxin oxidoreductase gamma subunit
MIPSMFVISIYGRAGQGVDSAIDVLSKSLAATGLNVQALFFPSQERRGPPVSGIVKVDKTGILSKQVEDYDIALVFDKSLDIKTILNSGKERSVVIMNSAEKFASPLLKKKKMKSYFLNATDVALRTTGRPMPNIAMLGALAKIYARLPLKNLRQLVEQSKEQVAALEEGHKTVK